MDVLNNWLSRPQKSNIPEPTALQALRSRQIEQLKSIDGRVTEIIRDQEYRVTVDEKSGLYLKISLPPQFPEERPAVSVSPKASHPWISEQMLVVGCTGVNNFMVHSDLGKVIREIIDEFRHNPPLILTVTSTQSMWSTQNALPSSYLPRHRSANESFVQPTYSDISHRADQSNLREFPNYDFFDTTPLSSQLDKMSLKEIENLKEDDEKLYEMVCSLPQLKKVTAYRKLLRQQLEKQAKENLGKKALLDEKKRIILEKYDQLNELRNKFDASSKRQDELLEMFSPQALQDNIKVAALEAEEAAEAVAEDFLEGKITIDEFNKTFMARRTLSHLRRVKEEKCVAPNGWKY